MGLRQQSCKDTLQMCASGLALDCDVSKMQGIILLWSRTVPSWSLHTWNPSKAHIRVPRAARLETVHVGHTSATLTILVRRLSHAQVMSFTRQFHPDAVGDDPGAVTKLGRRMTMRAM